MMPAIQPTSRATQGCRTMLALVPKATPPANVAFWMWTCEEKTFYYSFSFCCDVDIAKSITAAIVLVVLIMMMLITMKQHHLPQMMVF